MNKRFIRVAVFCALTATAAPVFVGCSDDYDADITGLQDQINKINGVVGITGDDMAAAIDEVVEQLQTKIDSLGGIVSDKVNVDELTASVNNLNQLIDQKADASQIQAEADRLQGLIDAANQAAADANQQVRQELEQQISELEQKQDEAQQALNAALNGKVSQDVLDNEAARLEELINDAKQIASGAVTPAQLDEKINTVMGEIEAAVEGKVTTAELEALRTSLNDAITAATNDMATNAAVQEKLDALDAELTEAIGKKMDVSTFNSLKNQLTTAIGAKADTAFVNQEIRDLSAELESVKAGYATTAITDQLRADLTTVTSDLVTVNNKLQEVDRLSTELGDAVAELDQAKLDLIALGDRIEALEDKNLSLSEYAEFSALANRVQMLEAKWGQDVRDSIENNTSAIESINLKLEAFFAGKADATAKDIYDKLVALETWKTDVVEQFMSGITNSEATGKLDQALADIEDLRTQLGLITKDPEEGEEGEEPTANFYDKEEIDTKFDALSTDILSILGSAIQSMVYVPNYDGNTSFGQNGLLFKTLTIEGVNNNMPVAQRSAKYIYFRIAPAAAATKENLNNNYDLKLDGQKLPIRSLPQGFEARVDDADPKTGIVRFIVTSGMPSDQMWALCATLKAKTPGQSAEGGDEMAATPGNFTDITSDYFTVTYQTDRINDVRLSSGELYVPGAPSNNTDITYKEQNIGDDKYQVNYWEGLVLKGYYNNNEVIADIQSEYGNIFTPTFSFADPSNADNALFSLSNGVLESKNKVSGDVGARTQVKAVVSYGNSWTAPTVNVFKTVTLTNIVVKKSYDLGTNQFTSAAGTPKPNVWSDAGRTFKLSDTEASVLADALGNMSLSELYTCSSVPGYVTDNGDRQATISMNSSGIYVILPADFTLEQSKELKLEITTTDAQKAELTVTLPAMTQYPATLDDFKPTEGFWSNDGVAGINIITNVNGVNQANLTNQDLKNLFKEYNTISTTVQGAGGSIDWSWGEMVNGVYEDYETTGLLSFDPSTQLLSISNAYDVTKLTKGNPRFKLTLTFGSHVVERVYQLRINNISAVWTKPTNPQTTLNDIFGSLDLAKGYSLSIAGTNAVVWKDGAKTANGTTTNVWGSDAFTQLGINAPSFTISGMTVNGQAVTNYADYVAVDAATGKLTVTPTGQSRIVPGTEVVVTVKVNVDTSFGPVTGYNTSDAITVTVTNG